MLKVEQRFDLTCESVTTTVLNEQHIFQCSECDKEFPKVKNKKKLTPTKLYVFGNLRSRLKWICWNMMPVADFKI